MLRRSSRWLVVPADVLGLALPIVWRPDLASPLLTTLGLVVLLYALGGLYRSRLHLSLLDEMPLLLGRSVPAVAVIAVGVGLANHGPSVGAFLAAAGAGLVAHLVLRACAYGLIRAARRRRGVAHRTLVLGGGELATELVTTLQERTEYGLLPVGYLDARPAATTPLPVPHLGSIDDLGRVIARHDVRILLVAFGAAREADMVDVMQTQARTRCEVFVVPRLYEVGLQTTDHIGAVPVLRLKRPPMQRPTWALKRLFDVVCSAGALIALSPVLAACALAVRLEGGPGIIFRQQRVGKDGELFELYKFRSLKPQDDTESQTNWNVSNDDRMGPVGRFLRRTSLDELPQLWNILVGHMTIVGPRPERPYFVERFSAEIPAYGHRHRVPAGLTGLAQVNGLRGDTSIAARARYDNFYIENWSLWMDVKVVLRTIREVVTARGG